jgi:hypothetical protein
MAAGQGITYGRVSPVQTESELEVELWELPLLYFCGCVRWLGMSVAQQTSLLVCERLVQAKIEHESWTAFQP